MEKLRTWIGLAGAAAGLGLLFVANPRVGSFALIAAALIAFAVVAFRAL